MPGPRKCVICGKSENRGESTFGFRTALRILGRNGDKAHPRCVREELKRQDDENRRHRKNSTWR